MSRVRVLNLPRTVTEADLRQHFTQPVGPRSTPLDMTDCRLVRKDDPASGKQVVRMAFVGFRTAAAGERAVKLFNGSYLGSQAIRVEQAQSLVDQRDQRRKEEDARKEKLAERRAERRRQRPDSATEDGSAAVEQQDGGPSAKRAPMSEADRLKEEFIARQLQRTGGGDGGGKPAWSGELLQPTAVDVQRAEAAAAESATRATEVRAVLEDEAAAAAAREKQQELADEDDMDFLASIAAPTAAAENKREEDQDQTAGVANDTVDVRQDAAATIGKLVRAPKLTEEQQIASESCRVRLANIPYTANSAEVKNFISSLVGDVAEVHLPVTKDTKQPKGIAFVTFHTSDAALRALNAHGAIFMGRLVRIAAAPPDPYKLKREVAAQEKEAAAAAAVAATAQADGSADGAEAAAAAAGGSYRREALAKKKRSDGDLMWNPLYVQSATAVAKVAGSLGVGADAVVSVDSGGAAVRAAVAEAYLTTEAQRTLGDEGINFAALDNASLARNRSQTAILVKHLPKGVSSRDVAQLFAKFGQLQTVAAPASGAFLLVEFVHETDAKTAFQKLAYKMVAGTPLFVEWAPMGAIRPTGADDVEDAEAEAELNALVKDSKKKQKAAALKKKAAEADDDGDVMRQLEKAAKQQQHGGADGESDDDVPAVAESNTSDDDDDDDVRPGGAGASSTKKASMAAGAAAAAAAAGAPPQAHIDVATVYITNLPFGITDAAFVAFLESTCRRIKDSPHLVVRIVLQDTKGRAFVTVSDTATANYLIAKVNGRTLDGRPLGAQMSRNTTTNLANTPAAGRAQDDTAAAPAAVTSGSGGAGIEVPAGRNPLKVMVKNLPFEATEQDLRQLFRSFSEVKSVRVPQKRGTVGSSHHQNNHRGFGFVEFLTEQEATNAMATLRNTHLYGRHLVLEYAQK